MKSFFAILLSIISAGAIAQQTTTVKIAPSKDTTFIKFTTVTTTTATTNTTYSLSTKPGDTTTTPPAPGGNYGTLIYQSGYDNVNDLDPFGNGQLGNGSLSTTTYRTAPGSFKSVPANVSAGIRSEVQYPDNLTPIEGTIEYDVFYEVVFQDNGHSLQFHPNTNGGSASPGFWHIGGKLVIVNWKGGTNTRYNTGFTIPAGRWLHIVFSYKMGSSGYMNLQIDGTTYLNVTGIQVGDNSGAYLKVGVNMWQNQQSVVYYDNLKIWKK